MKLLDILLILNLLIKINSYPWSNAVTFPNLTFERGLNFKLDGFFEYTDPDYLTERNVSEYCLTFNFETDNLVLQYACQNVCSEISFNKHTQDNSVYPDNTIGPIHCPMGGSVSRAYFKKEEFPVDGIFNKMNESDINLINFKLTETFLISLGGCYSIGEDDSPYYGSLIFKTRFPHNFSNLNSLQSWKPIPFSESYMGNCNDLCVSMMECKKEFGIGINQNFFIELLTLQNIFVLGVVFVFAVICTICAFKTLFKNSIGVYVEG